MDEVFLQVIPQAETIPKALLSTCATSINYHLNLPVKKIGLIFTISQTYFLRQESIALVLNKVEEKLHASPPAQRNGSFLAHLC